MIKYSVQYTYDCLLTYTHACVSVVINDQEIKKVRKKFERMLKNLCMSFDPFPARNRNDIDNDNFRLD